jgi:hypothetical protein
VSQGQGASTEAKERGIAHAISVSMRIASKMSFPFWYVDMNCGSGWNEKVGCIGSPLAFLDVAMEQGKAYRAFFCDIAEPLVVNLAGKFSRRTSANAYCMAGDNAGLLPVVEEVIRQSGENPKFVWGAVLVDPNSYRTQWPIDQVIAFAAKHPRIDLILNLNLRSYWRESALQRTGAKGWEHQRIPLPSDWAGLMNRAHGVVRAPSVTSGDRFILMTLRNIPAGSSLPMGFYDIHSSTGRDILQRADLGSRYLSSLPQLQRLFEAPDFPGCQGGGNGQGQLPLPVRSPGNGSPSP